MGGTPVLRGLRRRGFLAGAGAVATGLAVTPEAHAWEPPAIPYVRRDVWSFQTPWQRYTEAYARAVGVMMSREPTDPTSWSFQAAIHGSFVTPAHPSWSQCQHQSWHFLPWHRMYLFFFERIVRAAVKQNGGPADFALPYWNWQRPFPGNTLPLPFRVATLPDGSPNPLYLPTRRSTAMMEGFQLGPNVVSTTSAMTTTSFSAPAQVSKTSFGGGVVPPAQFAGALGALEQQPHNPIHIQVGGPTAPKCTGGYMSAVACAANDPIFFLHHANIDRLWNVWLARGGGRANPADPAWLNQSFTFYDEAGQPVTMTASQVLTITTQLGYRYA